MIITSKGFTETVKIYDTHNAADMDELSGFIGKHYTYYNNNDNLVIETPTAFYVRVRLNGKYAVCSPIDATTITLKKKKRGEYNLLKSLYDYTPIDALVKTNVPGFKQWCNVESYTSTHGKHAYHIRNKSGRAIRIVPLKDSSTGRIFTILDRITAVKRV